MRFRFLKTNFHGDPNIGLYSFATDNYCLLGLELKKNILNKMKKTLNVKISTTTVAGTELMGIFVAGNKNGILLPKIMEKNELLNFKKFKINFEIIKSKYTALGNLILCNDKGCLISSKLKKHKKQIEDILDCEVETGIVAGTEIIGSAARASNIGCLCHRDTTEKEIKLIEDLLKVKADVGTINYGTPFIKAGVIVNSNGVIFSEQSTGPEIGRIDEVFRSD